MIVVLKIGTSSVTLPSGDVDVKAIHKLAGEVSQAWREGYEVVVVTSGAITAGVAAMALVDGRPTDARTLQAISSVGQHRLMRVYDDAFDKEGRRAGQVLLAPLDFTMRTQYLHARETILRLMELGVVPVVNENDAIADDEIRFGDNDRLAALVANLLGASLLVLLTDTDGLFDADPRFVASASLIEEVAAADETLKVKVSGPSSAVGSGGMASKLAAARMAAWSGIRTVIGPASRPEVLKDILEHRPGVGTVVLPHDRRMGARKLWIAFALPASGCMTVDAGARQALVERDASLLVAGVTGVAGKFGVDDAVEIAGPDGVVFAKGLSRVDSSRSGQWLGCRSKDLPGDISSQAVHRDDLVVLI